MINSINFIDGLDGLSSGIALIAAVTLGPDLPDDRPSASRSSRSCASRWPGALLGFLRWNFHPASIFIGTSGVMFVGYTLALLSILGTAKVAVALLVLGVPIIDTFWIIVRRLATGARRSRRTAATSTTGCSTWACRNARRSSLIYGHLHPPRRPLAVLSGAGQLYAFMGWSSLRASCSWSHPALAGDQRLRGELIRGLHF